MRKETVHQRILDLNAKLDALEEKLSDYSYEELNWSPEPESWSVMQVLNHLYLAEKYSLDYIRKKLSFKPKLRQSNIASRFRAFVLNTYLDLPFKFSAPKGVSTEYLPKESKLEDVMSDWRNMRKELDEFLMTQPDSLFRMMIYKHPIMGRLPIKDMITFYEKHFNRHKKQIKRVLKAIRTL